MRLHDAELKAGDDVSFQGTLESKGASSVDTKGNIYIDGKVDATDDPEHGGLRLKAQKDFVSSASSTMHGDIVRIETVDGALDNQSSGFLGWNKETYERTETQKATCDIKGADVTLITEEGDLVSEGTNFDATGGDLSASIGGSAYPPGSIKFTLLTSGPSPHY